MILRSDGPADVPRLALLTPRWGARSESGWVVRQVAGALAQMSDVHILTPQGQRPRQYADGVFHVHEAASALRHSVTLHCDLAVAMLPEEPLGGVAGRRLVATLDEEQEKWAPLEDTLRSLAPDVVVLVGHRELGAARLVERIARPATILGLPLLSRLANPENWYFAPWFAALSAAIAFTEAEAAMVDAAGADLAVHVPGLPLAANPSVRREPHTFVGKAPYALVVTGAPWEGPHWPATVTALLHDAFPHRSVVVSATDRLVQFRHGELRETSAVERGTDLLRLLAWAAMVVDVRPGPLVGRRVLESMLYGSPVIVPATSRAREHAEAGRGGLWFSGAGDLLWCVDALFDDPTREALGQQGRRYAEEHYSGTDRFVRRVLGAIEVRSEGSVAAR